MTSMRCARCRASLRQETATYVQTIAGAVSIVMDVEAEMCPQCGEQYLSPDTVEKIQALIERGQAAETREVPVYRLPQPTP